MQSFSSFAEFYPFYLGEHANRTTRRLHFAGSSLALLCVAMLIFTGDTVVAVGGADRGLRLCLGFASGG